MLCDFLNAARKLTGAVSKQDGHQRVGGFARSRIGIFCGFGSDCQVEKPIVVEVCSRSVEKLVIAACILAICNN